MGLPLKGPLYKSAVEHLKAKNFCQVSEKLNANIFGEKIREAIVEPFRWNSSVFTLPHTSLEAREIEGLDGRNESNNSRTPMNLLYRAAVPAATKDQIASKSID